MTTEQLARIDNAYLSLLNKKMDLILEMLFKTFVEADQQPQAMKWIADINEELDAKMAVILEVVEKEETN